MLDPQARALIDLMTERGVPPTHTLAPAEAKSLDDFGSRGRSRAAAQNRATISASSQSTVTAASLSVTASPPLA